jgi:hypothetical protein
MNLLTDVISAYFCTTSAIFVIVKACDLSFREFCPNIDYPKAMLYDSINLYTLYM